MKKLLIALVFISEYGFSQSATQYEVTQEGFTDFVVAEIPGKSANEIYTKTLEWISKTYKNPKEVLKAEVLNDYIRFEGVASGLNCYAPFGIAVCNNVKYEVEISVKENKYKFDVIGMQEYVTPSKYITGGWTTIYPNNNTSFLFKKTGEIRGGWKDYYQKIPTYFNNLNDDLKKYIESGVKSETKSDW